LRGILNIRDFLKETTSALKLRFDCTTFYMHVLNLVKKKCTAKLSIDLAIDEIFSYIFHRENKVFAK
jgi:hypothetical protein